MDRRGRSHDLQLLSGASERQSNETTRQSRPEQDNATAKRTFFCLPVTWFPAVPGLAERLAADPPARVADVGCGTGWSTIAIAQGFPKAVVTGIDLDRASIEEHVPTRSAPAWPTG